MTWRRRDVLRLFGTSVATAACSNTATRPPPPCIEPGTATGAQNYCLVAGEVLRVPNATAIAIGQAALFNVDDDTAVVIARDAGGIYAMSAICTHQCCLVALCSNQACTDLGTNPGECGSTAIAMPAPTGAAMICPCHGSAFAFDGTVLTGPAVRSLPHYALAFEGDDALVDVSTVVDPATRI